jgi:hypothetical protein
MSKTQQAQEVINRLLQHRKIISLHDDIAPEFEQHPELRPYMTFAVWGCVKTGKMSRLLNGSGAYMRA